MSNLVLNGKTFTGQGNTNGLSLWLYAAAGIVAAFQKVTAKVTYGKQTNTHWKIETPTVIAEDSTCGCAGELKYTSYAHLTVNLDRRATAAERTAMLQEIRDLVASDQFGSSITSLITPN